MFHISQGIRNAKTVDGAVLLDINRNRILATNVVGANIFELMKLGFDKSQIVEEICRLFQVSIKTATDDVDEFAESLLRCGVLLEIASPERP